MSKPSFTCFYSQLCAHFWRFIQTTKRNKIAKPRCQDGASRESVPTGINNQQLTKWRVTLNMSFDNNNFKKNIVDLSEEEARIKIDLIQAAMDNLYLASFSSYSVPMVALAGVRACLIQKLTARGGHV